MSDKISDPGPLPRLGWVTLAAIKVDRNYQRDIKPRMVQKILREFTWSRFQPLMLSELGGGMYNCFDGQHKLEAARLHPDILEVPAYIVRLNGVKAEAAAFVSVNTDRAAVSTIERYWAGLEAGDADMMAVCSVLGEADCDVVPCNGHYRPNLTNAVTAVSRAIKNFGDEAVIKACKTIRNAWPTNPNSLKGIIVESLARMYSRNENLNFDHMVAVLHAVNIKTLASRAESQRQISGGSAATNVARVMAAGYNKGQRTSKHIDVGVK